MALAATTNQNQSIKNCEMVDSKCLVNVMLSSALTPRRSVGAVVSKLHKRQQMESKLGGSKMKRRESCTKAR
ncbi:hypothetical protein SLA2020_157000 [Shorea laevis]